MEITGNNLHWTAGFLEGEGSFFPGPNPGIRFIKISAVQCQREPLERLQKMFGGSIHSYLPDGPRRKPCSIWYLHGAQAAGLMMALYPLLSPQRQARIQAALARWRLQVLAPKYRVRCPQGHLYRETGVYYGRQLRSGKRTRCCRVCRQENARHRRLKENPDLLPLPQFRTQCSRGHLYDKENTRYSTQKGGRYKQRTCRTCARENMRRYRMERYSQTTTTTTGGTATE